MGLKCTLWVLIWRYSHRNWRKVKELQQTICKWIIDSKAVSWTDVGYSFRYFYINQAVKRSGVDSKCAICIWKLLLWTHIMQSKDLSIQVKETIVRLQKQNKSTRELAGTFRVAKSTVWYILRKTITHQWAQQHKKTWTSTENVLSNGKEKPFHNIQPREEHSPGGSCVTVQVYNQEKTSQEKIQRVHNKVQTRPD